MKSATRWMNWNGCWDCKADKNAERKMWKKESGSIRVCRDENMEKVKLSDICNPKQWKTIPTGDLLDEGYPVYGANGIIGYYSEYNHETPVVAVTCRGATCGSLNITVPNAYVTGNAMCLDEVRNDVNINYLYYCLKHYDFNNVISGSAQPQITRQGMDKIFISICCHDKQCEIVDRLKKIENVIDLRKREIVLLDNLIKARFVEMFANWKKKYLAEPLGEYLQDITYGFTNPMPDAEEGPWKITAKDVVNGIVNLDTARKTLQESYDKLTEKSKPQLGDVLLTKDGTLGRTAVVEIGGMCVNQSVAVLRINEKILPKYLSILLQMPKYQRDMIADAGGGTIKHIYITKVVKMPIVVPSIEEQNTFLDFVNQVDKSKVAVQKALDEAQLLFDSLMQQYFG